MQQRLRPSAVNLGVLHRCEDALLWGDICELAIVKHHREYSRASNLVKLWQRKAGIAPLETELVHQMKPLPLLKGFSYQYYRAA
jgi:hypothetical protein